MIPIRLDLNNPVFQSQWFTLEREERLAVLNCCAKLASIEWSDVYRDRRLRSEAIQSRTGHDRQRLYSIRVTQRMRAVVRRSGEFFEFVTLHSDHTPSAGSIGPPSTTGRTAFG